MVVVDRMFDAAPPELRALKARSLATTHVYVARSFLTRCNDRSAVTQAARSLRALIQLQPGMLLDPIVLRLCARWLVAWTLSPKRASALADRYHRVWSQPLSEIDPWA